MTQEKLQKPPESVPLGSLTPATKNESLQSTLAWSGNQTELAPLSVPPSGANLSYSLNNSLPDSKSLINLPYFSPETGAASPQTTQNQEKPQGQSSAGQRTPQEEGALYALVDGGVISVPLVIGTLMVIVGAAGIVIKWKDINDTITELGEIAIDWASDTASAVTDKIIEQVGGTQSTLGMYRAAIEGVVSNVFAAKKKKPKDEESQESDEKSGNEEPNEEAERDWKQDQKLNQREIEALKQGGEDPEELKEYNAKLDLFKDKKGNIYVKPKNGQGPGNPTNLNIRTFL